jgi:hypothetical protein
MGWLGLVGLLCGAVNAAQFGRVTGTYRLRDGTPCRFAPIAIRAGTKTLACSTDRHGRFTAIVPAGTATVTAAGITAVRAQVPANGTLTLTLSARATGVVLTVLLPSGAPANAVVTGAYRTARSARTGLPAISVGEARHWFAEVPAQATDFAAHIRLLDRDEETVLQHQWHFTELIPVHAIALTVSNPIRVTLKVVDLAGAPVREGSITGTFWYPPRISVPTYWTPPTEARLVAAPFSGHRTDAEGDVTLGAWPPGRYGLMLKAGEQQGVRIPFEITLNGKCSLTTYTVGSPLRTMSHPALGPDGKPRPQATLWASYAWQGRLHLVQATADAQGQVRWANLPPVRVIVWGAGVPAGVLPATGTSLTGPLPAPGPENELRLRVSLTEAGEEPAQLLWVTRGGDRGEVAPPVESHYRPARGEDPGTPGALVTEWALPSGIPFSLLAFAHGKSPRVASLERIYLPYTDLRDPLALTLPLTPAPEVRGTLVAGAGLPVPGVSRLAVLPVQVAEGLRPLVAQLVADLPPLVESDGAFRLVVPVPGVYRLLVDLFDESTPGLTNLLLTVRPGVQQHTVALPPPLLTLPPGTRVSWVTARAPLTPRSLTVSANAPQMPLFGLPEQLLACWYRTVPARMSLWRHQAGIWAEQSQALRAVTLTPAEWTGAGPWQLLPGLPAPGEELAAESLARRTPRRTDLWSGSYLVLERARTTPVGTLEVPAAPAPPRWTAWPALPAPPRLTVSLKAPAADYAALARQGADSLTLMSDSPFSPETLPGVPADQLTASPLITLSLPPTTRTLTVQWLGVGVIRDVPLQSPPGGVLTLPAWSAGATLTARVLLADGRPYANNPLLLTPAAGRASAKLVTRTDGQGRVTIKGLLPGLYSLFLEPTEGWANWPVERRQQLRGGWTLAITTATAPEIVLQADALPCRITGLASQESGHLWWVPDTGPIALLTSRPAFGVAYGPGWAWRPDGDQGRATAARLTLTPGAVALPQHEAGAPTLGVSVPLRADGVLPGPLTLVGMGARAGVHLAFPRFRWVPAPLLGRVYGQIDALPPGTYTVRVSTPVGLLDGAVTVESTGAVLALPYPESAADTTNPAR